MLVGAQLVLFYGLIAVVGGLSAVCFVLGFRTPS